MRKGNTLDFEILLGKMCKLKWNIIIKKYDIYLKQKYKQWKIKNTCCTLFNKADQVNVNEWLR